MVSWKSFRVDLNFNFFWQKGSKYERNALLVFLSGEQCDWKFLKNDPIPILPAHGSPVNSLRQLPGGNSKVVFCQSLFSFSKKRGTMVSTASP